MLSDRGIGRVFTPVAWAKWLVEQTGAYRAWCEGATVCDPTFGGGAFIAAFCELAQRDGIALTSARVGALYGRELEPSDKPRLLRQVYEKYGVTLVADNFTVGDVLSPLFSQRFDVLVGNPPWCNFSALPSEFRERWAEMFLEHGLVRNRKDVLLGASRADIATLILKKTIDENLQPGGLASFFVPLSIFFNSGANDLFRPYPGSSHRYQVAKLWDFVDEKIFDVSTRYGAVKIIRSAGQKWPVETFVRSKTGWLKTSSSSSDGAQGFWQRYEKRNARVLANPKIVIAEGQKPRQGLNTCGANHVLIIVKDKDRFINGLGEIVDVEEELLYPLIDKANFAGEMVARRMVLVPHAPSSGRPLTAAQLSRYPRTVAYLNSKRGVLEQRKGTLLSAHIKRGTWWALLGVGPYSFAPWKVAWEALGKSAFKPRVFPGRWQGNQALHAYCPCESEIHAEHLKRALSAPSVEEFLRASAMGGTLNWAQPGRVSKLLQVEVAQGLLFA